jgi:hypothetical protein
LVTSGSSRIISLGLLGWLVAGVIVYLVVTLIVDPFGPTMGVAFSPERIGYMYLQTFAVWVPLSAFLMYRFSRHPEWIAPVGKYVPGRSYKVWSSWTLAAIAITAALYAGTGFISGVTNVDLPALVTAFMAAYFGPIVALPGIVVGAFIRFALGGMPWLAPPTVVAFAFTDATKWVVAGSLIFWIVRARGKGLFTAGAWALVVPASIVAWLFITMANIFTQGPWEYFEGFFFFFFVPVVLVTSIISIIVGLGAAEAVYAAVKRGRKGPVTSST